jgi:hypothetical protein
MRRASLPAARLAATGLAVLAVLAIGLAAPAAAEGPHQHGAARLDVVVDGPALTVTLDSPLDNLLAFERAPRTAAERAAVQAMAQRLHAAAALLQPTPAAGCTLRDVALASEVIDPALLAKSPPSSPAAAPARPPPAGAHADLEAGFRFDCATPAALKGLALGGLFQAFPKLRQLDVAVAAPGVQRGFRLVPGKPQIAW